MGSRLPDIFLSYSRDDQATARRFAEGFERAGFTVWWDATLDAGQAYDEVTEKALQEAKAVVVLWSKTSAASRWVRAEATQAIENQTLVPVMIEACKRPIMFELTHTADLSHWRGDPNDKAWQSYLAGLRRFLDKGEPERVAPPAARGSGHATRFSAKSLGILAVFVIVAGIAWTVTHWSAKTPAQAAQSTEAGNSGLGAKTVTSPPGFSLAVLPFINLSGDPQQEYFSDGLTEELMNQLAQIKDLRLIARASSFSFKGKNEDVRVIGEKLGVGDLLEGSVRKSGNTLRITAELINAKDGTDIWTATYDRELTDVFAVQEQIAEAVSEALSIKLDVGEVTRAQGGTSNIDAYDKFLRANKLYEQGGAKALTEAAQLYRDALVLDPAFARAWFALYTTLRVSTVWIPERAVAERAEMAVASERVTALAPDVWWAEEMRSSQLIAKREWSQAEAAARAAAASAPPSYESCQLLTPFAHVDDWISCEERARYADPLSLSVSVNLQMGLDMANRPEDAQTEYERSKTLTGDPAIADFRQLQRLWLSKASPAAVAAQLHRFLEHEAPKMALHHILAERADDRGAALAAIRKAYTDPANQDSTRIYMILLYADHYGDRDLALAAMRRYFDLEGPSVYPLWWPYESGLRSDPRFKAILRDLGLVDYFRTSGNWGDFCKPVGKDDFECH
jgi:TolB-like protein